jgi:hypothetical protein
VSLLEFSGVQSRLFSLLAWFTSVGSIVHGIRIFREMLEIFLIFFWLCGIIEDISQGLMAPVIYVGAKAKA